MHKIVRVSFMMLHENITSLKYNNKQQPLFCDNNPTTVKQPVQKAQKMGNNTDPLFNGDPLYMRSLIGKEIEVKTVNKKIYKGLVYVIDPIFKTLVLHCNRISETEYETVIILNHSIETLSLMSNEVNPKYLQTLEEAVSSNIARKDSVKKWLQHMQINVDESGDFLKLDDHLIILPPYKLENCVSNNTIILERVRNILKQMPPDFK